MRYLNQREKSTYVGIDDEITKCSRNGERTAKEEHLHDPTNSITPLEDRRAPFSERLRVTVGDDRSSACNLMDKDRLRVQPFHTLIQHISSHNRSLTTNSTELASH